MRTPLVWVVHYALAAVFATLVIVVVESIAGPFGVSDGIIFVLTLLFAHELREHDRLFMKDKEEG